MNFDEIVVKESPGLCRCCLSEGCYKDLGTEYTWMNENEVYADMLLECFDISISQHTDGPNGSNRLICEVCITRLRDACNFKKQVLDSEKKFVDMLARGEFQPKVIMYQAAPLKTEQLMEEPAAEDVEYLEDMDYEDDLPLNQVGQLEASVSDLASTVKVKGKRGRPKKTTSPVKTEKKPKISKMDAKPQSSKAVAKGAKQLSEEDKSKRLEAIAKLQIKRRNIEYILQYSNVTPFLWYKGKFRCYFCTETMDHDALREHTAKVHQFANVELVVHDRTKNNRSKDAAVKVDVSQIACKLCPATIANVDQLIHHLIITHDAEYDMSIPNCLLPFKLDDMTCPTCNMKFVFFEYLLRHANKQHLSHEYFCHVCGASFQGDNHLRMHIRYYHREGGYSCDQCGVTLSTLSKKLLHEKNVHMVNLSTCPHCPETFKSRYLKNLHLANVHGIEELKIRCPFCPKIFPQESIMSRHMRRVHLKEKNVECDVCREKFFGPYDLKLHMAKHNGEKNFVCSVCGKKFSKKSNLNTHSVIHTGEKNYSCLVCQKPFVHAANLKLHMKNRHQPEEPAPSEVLGIMDDIEETEIQMEFIGDELEGAEVTGQYVQ